MPGFFIPLISDQSEQSRANLERLADHFKDVPVPEWFAKELGITHLKTVPNDTDQADYNNAVLGAVGLPGNTPVEHDWALCEDYTEWIRSMRVAREAALAAADDGDDEEEEEEEEVDLDTLTNRARVERLIGVNDDVGMKVIQASLRNGPVQAGVGAVGDHPDYKGLKPADASPIAVYSWLNNIKRCRSLDKGMVRQAFAMAAILKYLGGFNFPGDATVARISDEDIKTVEAMEIPSYDQIDVSHAISCVVACKVSFWQTNHHVGAGGLTKVVQKVLSSQAAHYKWGTKIESTESSRDIINPLWLMVHLFDTRAILAIAGCKGVIADKAIQSKYSKVFVAAKDLAIRARACPAGTAKVYDCAAVIDMMSKSVISPAITFTEEMVKILAARRAIQGDPASYHIGAHFLTGAPMRASIEPSIELVIVCKTFLTKTAKFSSLLEATVFKDASVDQVLANSIAKAIATHSEAFGNAEFITADTVKAAAKVSEELKNTKIAEYVKEYKSVAVN
jgi:hypothetical protein